MDAQDDAVHEGYSVFAKEVKNIEETYSPKTLSHDGWGPTKRSWKRLFPTAILILCFLHAFIKIRGCSKKSLHYKAICKKFWQVYFSPSKRVFSQRLRRYDEWSKRHLEGTTAHGKIASAYSKSAEYQMSYDHPNAYRTSSHIDRLINVFDRKLFMQKNLHGPLLSAKKTVRAWGIFQNFYPYSARSRRDKDKVFALCPAAELNGFSYSNNWLENLVISTSMNGYRR